MRFYDKVAIVTGAASGIGEATALQFAKEGAAVVVVDLVDPAGTVSEIVDAGGKAVGVQGSVGSLETIKKMIEAAVSQFGRIDILVNNAGVPFPAGPVEHIDEEAWDEAYAVNVKSGFMASKYAMPHLRKTRGSILFTSSVAGLAGASNMVTYSSTKSAVINMARSIALDHAPEGIRVNVICPGATQTPLVENGPVPAGALAASLPLKRMVQAEEVAKAFAYLASDDASSITGQVMILDSGYSAGNFTSMPSIFDK